VLVDLDLDLAPGRLTVVRGPSGSGKSTLLRILAGLERPDAGTVCVTGHDLGALDRTRLAALRREAVGVSGQAASLVDAIDVVENLELVSDVRGLARDRARVGAWLEAFGLAALGDREVRVLSGGERQRVSVARTLAAGPALALLDEPTSQQDEASAERLVAVLLAAARSGIAVVAATHDPVLVASADSVVTLG
jgi:ABC-type lipoprotein export system ATPase subunit